MRSIRFAAIIIFSLSFAEAAEAPSSEITLSVYNNDFALVQDTRRMSIAPGRSRLEFRDVSASIKPETVTLSASNLDVVEQNFDYDLVTPAKMMEKAVGRQIQILRTNPATGAQTTETATVLSVNEGVVLKIGNRIEVLRDDGIPTRVIFASMPENLRAHPTLSVTVDAAGGGARDITLSYLTRGLSWKADYVAMFNEQHESMRLQGWVTLINKSGTTYRNAKTQLIAGDVNLVNSEDDYWQRERRKRATTTLTAGTGSDPETSIADYHLYRLPERVTVAENQTKQVSFLELADVKTAKAYQYRWDAFESSPAPQHVASVLRFANKGVALPAGVVRVYMRDEAGEPKFVGEDALDHVPAGSELSIKTGEAFDVTVQTTLVESQRLSKWNNRYSMSYEFHNAGSSPAIVELFQGGLRHDSKVETESEPSRRVDAHTLTWTVAIPAAGSKTLTVTVATGS